MTHSAKPPFYQYSGSLTPKIVLVGEAWGEKEEELQAPFVGESGKELFRMLGEVMPDESPQLHAEICEQFKYGNSWVSVRQKWLDAAAIGLTNVLAFRPPSNNLEACCGTKDEVGKDTYGLPSILRGKYLRPEYLGEVQRLEVEITKLRPTIIVALGNTALWALLGSTNIGSVRGTVVQGPGTGPAGGCKILSTYHPAAVLRQWPWRSIVVADLLKAFRESGFPEIRRPERRVLVDPTLAEVEEWTHQTLDNPPAYLAPDIETSCGQITCIGFARSVGDALVVPFWDKRQASWSYWPHANAEKAAWNAVARLLESPIPKVGQNFIYDLQYITRLGIRPRNCVEDTMLMHHSKFPELQKGLGFLGSIYTNESSWKLLRKRKADTEKKDE